MSRSAEQGMSIYTHGGVVEVRCIQRVDFLSASGRRRAFAWAALRTPAFGKGPTALAAMAYSVAGTFGACSANSFSKARSSVDSVTKGQVLQRPGDAVGRGTMCSKAACVPT